MFSLYNLQGKRTISPKRYQDKSSQQSSLLNANNYVAEVETKMSTRFNIQLQHRNRVMGFVCMPYALLFD